MKILITGAAGEIASDFAPWIARHHDVRLTDLREPETDLEFTLADISEPSCVERLVEGVDAVAHFAALLPFEYGPAAFCDVNVKGTTLLLAAAVAAGVKRFVFISTVWATGHGSGDGAVPVDEDAPARPVELYGLTKLMGETATEYYGRMSPMSAVVIRFAGYKRHHDFARSGDIDWGRADIASLAYEMLRDEQKLYNPNDLGAAVKACLEADVDGFARYVIANELPYVAEDAAQVADDPTPLLERAYPGAADFFRELGIHPPRLTSWYSTAKAERDLGWRNEYTLGELMTRYRQRRKDVL
jgi:UDP-glucose 4-epimerase